MILSIKKLRQQYADLEAAYIAQESEIERLRAESARTQEAMDILHAAMVAKKPIPVKFKHAIIKARAALEEKK